MKKLFVSVPMKGRTEENIRKSIAKMKAIAEAYEGEELELINSYVEDTPPKDGKTAIWYLSKSLEKLAGADIFIGVYDPYEWNGCYIEREVARRYGIKSYEVHENIVLEDWDEICKKRYESVPVCDCNGK